MQDIRYGIRTLLRIRGFAATALITLTLAIGATTAVFSVVDAVLLRPLPYPDSRRLIQFFEDVSLRDSPRARVSPPTFIDLKAQTALFEDVAAVNETSFNRGGEGGDTLRLNGALVTYNLFSVLGVKPLVGRTFLPEEDHPGTNHVVLLSYPLWRDRFSGNAGIVGQTLRLNHESYTVAGVMPPGFSFPEREINPIDVWTPRAFTSQELTARRARYLLAVGRIRTGRSIEEANAALRVLAAQNRMRYPNEMQGVSRYFAEPLQESDTHDARPGLLMLLFVVTLILLIACANMANLLLSRANARSREIALRAALGAGRGRILKQLLTEGLLLSIAAGVLGTCLALASFGLLERLIPSDLLQLGVLRFNLPVFTFTVLICFTSCLLFGLAPAWQLSNANPGEVLHDGGRASTGSRHMLGSALVTAEIALSLMLLVGAGLLLKSLYNLQQVNPGFQEKHALALDFDMAEPKYRDWNVRIRFQQQILDGVRSLPGVESAGFTGDLPLTSKGWNEDVTPAGSIAASAGYASVAYEVITPGYLKALGVPLIQGRFFTNRDREDAPLSAIVNQKAAQDFWPNQNPIGKRLKLGRIDSDGPWMEVVGLVGNVKHAGLTEPPRAGVYRPYLQARTTLQWQRFLVARFRGEPLGIVRGVRQVAASIDPDEPPNHVMALSELAGRETAPSRLQTTLLGGLAVLALVMASVGVYGVMAYLVTQRSREMGVRIALGAESRQIFTLILQRGLMLASIGVLAGICAALGLTRLIAAFLFGVSPTDISVIGVASIVLIVVSLAACLIPARRAACVDPLESLRNS